MGLFASKLWDYLATSLGGQDNSRILMLGLDAAGKTTLLYKLKLNENVVTIPTIGFNVETVDLGKGINFTIWDVGGQNAVRKLWAYYYENSKGLVFVVDSSDRTRLDEAREELFGILQSDQMRGVPFVVFANKQDLPGACSASELVQILRLQDLKNHKWYIQATCAVSGEGVFEGMFQMADLAKEFKRSQK